MPLALQPLVVRAAMGRLRDKTCLVRRSALALLTPRRGTGGGKLEPMFPSFDGSNSFASSSRLRLGRCLPPACSCALSVELPFVCHAFFLRPFSQIFVWSAVLSPAQPARDPTPSKSTVTAEGAVPRPPSAVLEHNPYGQALSLASRPLPWIKTWV